MLEGEVNIAVQGETHAEVTDAVYESTDSVAMVIVTEAVHAAIWDAVSIALYDSLDGVLHPAEHAATLVFLREVGYGTNKDVELALDDAVASSVDDAVIRGVSGALWNSVGWAVRRVVIDVVDHPAYWAVHNAAEEDPEPSFLSEFLGRAAVFETVIRGRREAKVVV